MYAKKLADTVEVKAVKFSFMSAVHSPSFCTIKERCEHDCLVDLQFGRGANTMAIPY